MKSIVCEELGLPETSIMNAEPLEDFGGNQMICVILVLLLNQFSRSPPTGYPDKMSENDGVGLYWKML